MEMMERIVAPSNVRESCRRVKRNGGCPGVDGMSVEELKEYLCRHWQQVREELLRGTYKPSAIKQHKLPKPGGGTRILGIPTVLDRLIQQAVLQVLQPEWDPTFSEYSYGFRPGKSAHQAVDKAREHYRAGYHRVVDLDLEKFFDRVNHDKLMSRVRERVEDRRVRRLIRRYLQAGRAFVSNKSIRRLKTKVRQLTNRSRGRRIEQIIRELATYLRGWQQYYKYGYQK